MIEKLNIEDIKPSSRRYPGIIFETERSLGDQILNIESMNTSIINDFSTIINNGDKVIFYSKNPKIIDSFYNEILLMNEIIYIIVYLFYQEFLILVFQMLFYIYLQ